MAVLHKVDLPEKHVELLHALQKDYKNIRCLIQGTSGQALPAYGSDGKGTYLLGEALRTAANAECSFSFEHGQFLQGLALLWILRLAGSLLVDKGVKVSQEDQGQIRLIRFCEELVVLPF